MTVITKEEKKLICEGLVEAMSRALDIGDSVLVLNISLVIREAVEK